MSAKSTKESRIYHIIDSVKGGCGKTTLAIVLANYLEQEDLEGTTCLLDVDFYGTGMVNLFYDERELKAFDGKYIYLNQKIRGFGQRGKKYIHDVGMGGESNCFYIGFADPSREAKDEFRVSSRNNYIPAVRYGKYRNGIRNILKRGELEKQVKLDDKSEKQIKNIIFDMAPGNDICSDSIRDGLFDRSAGGFVKEVDKRNYYLMVGMDNSHLIAAENYLLQMLGNDDALPDRIFVVFNDIMNITKSIENSGGDSILSKNAINHYSILQRHFERTLADRGIDLNDRLYYLVMNPYDVYAQHVQMGKCLTLLKKNIFPGNPFRLAFNVEKHTFEDNVNNTAEEVLNWLLYR